MSRNLSKQDLFYDSISDTWQTFIANYDTNRRIDCVFQYLLNDYFSKDKSILEVGIGMGEFCKNIPKLPRKEYLGIDISENLVNLAKEKYRDLQFLQVDLLELNQKIADRKFDIVYCSEVIEHTPDPHKAVAQLANVLCSNGVLAITVPNRCWIWLLRLAHLFGIRKYHGYENWLWPWELMTCMKENKLTIIKKSGVHFIPWHFLPLKIHSYLDRKLQPYSYFFALNLAILAKKN